MTIWKNWNTDEHLGQVIREHGLHDLREDKTAAVIYFRNASQATEISSCMQDSRFTIIDLENENENENPHQSQESDQTQSSSTPGGCYIILDRGPSHIYEKRKAGCLGTGYIFGRGTYADVILKNPRSKSSAISRSHFELKVRKGFWVIERLSTQSVRVNHVSLSKIGDPIALDPQAPNTVRLPGDVILSIYCFNPLRLDFIDNLLTSGERVLLTAFDLDVPVDQPSSFRTAQTSARNSLLPEAQQSSDTIVLWESPLPGRSPNARYHGLDPVTCEQKVVKIPHNGDATKLELRLELESKIPDCKELIKDEKVIFVNAEAAIICPLKPVTPLRQYIGYVDLVTMSAAHSTARGLLWALLKTLRHLHMHDVIHGDIGLDTVLISHLDSEDVDIFVGGMSEIQPLVKHDTAKNGSQDSLMAFRTILDMLQMIEETDDEINVDLVNRQGWLGHPFLDDLWSKIVSGDSWTLTVLEICETINLSVDYQQPWHHVQVTYQHHMRVIKEEQELLVNYDDLVEYIRRTIMRYVGRTDRSGIMSLISTCLKVTNKSGTKFCSDSAFRTYCRHVARKFGCSIGPSFTLEIARAKSQSGPEAVLDIPFHFKISTYHPLSLFNMNQLLKVCRISDRGKVQHVITSRQQDQIYEIRGDWDLQGIYLPIAHLEQIATELQLTVSNFTVPQPVNFNYEDYRYESWILLAHLPQSCVVFLHRKTRMVHWDGNEMYFVDFLNKHMPRQINSILASPLEARGEPLSFPTPSSQGDISGLSYHESLESKEDPEEDLKFIRSSKAKDDAKRVGDWAIRVETRPVAREIKRFKAGET